MALRTWELKHGRSLRLVDALVESLAMRTYREYRLEERDADDAFAGFVAMGPRRENIEASGNFIADRGYVVASDRPTGTVRCSEGCGSTVAVEYLHELDTGVTCGDCFERLTVA